MKYLILLGLIACNPTPEQDVRVSKYQMHCEKVAYAGDNIFRCENHEAICYRTYNGGIDCAFRID